MAGGYDFREIEKEILKFWEDNKVYPKIKERNKKNEKFTYLDGPPYTSGKMHLGTAWGKSLRDSIMRYKRMKGFDVWDRAGFDMHGLPTENKVAAKFNFSSKEEIEEFGVAKFQKECEDFCLENMQLMIEGFRKIGVWMDFDDPYMPIKPEFMEGEWFLAKKAYEDKRLYKGSKVMTWCPTCETSLSKHELEYENVSDKSIFVKFKVKEDEYLIIWTTTPWTIPFNLAIMANPELDYVRMKVDDEVWIMAKGLVGVFMGSVVGKDYEIIEEFKGDRLEGTRYEHVFRNEADVYDELKEYNKAFTVVLSEDYVDLSAGTGLVHCAPGCGPEDHEIGMKYGLPAFNEVDGHGTFSERMKKFSGLVAKRDDHVFIEHLRNSGNLVECTQVDHDYAHCWRCHKPIIYRATEQWFFKVEDLKERMIEFNKDIKWVPQAAFNAFESWLRNLKDNGITRQRFWGTPVPIWECPECQEITVIGSIDELKEKAGKLPDNFHIPWIDEITIPCKCGASMQRIPDIFDVWIDAGCAGWLCYNYPQDKETFERYFPADLILEGKDQIRGWFNLLMVASTLAFDSPSFKNVYMHGFINDYRGVKMSKSLGNVTDPNEIIEQFGADVLRYYTIGAANPGMDMNYNPEDPKMRLKNLMILWNLHKYILDTIETTGADLSDPGLGELGMEEKYILSRLNSTIRAVTERYEGFLLNEVPDLVEGFYLDFSRNYVQYIRDKVATGSEQEKATVVKVMVRCMKEIIKVFAPVSPFITEKIYQNMKPKLGSDETSIHEHGWPEYDADMIDEGLEKSFDAASRAIQSILRAREKVQIGVRWPVREVVIEAADENARKSLRELTPVIMNQVNAKEVRVVDKFDKSKVNYKADFKQLGPLCGADTPQVITELSQDSAETIDSHLKKAGKFTVHVGDKSYDIEEKHLIKEQSVPKEYQPEDFREGTVFLYKEMDEELEAEGMAREIVRRIQNARKSLGLNKSDAIKLSISTDDKELKGAILKWRGTILDRVGAKELGNEAYKNKFEEKVKGISFTLYIES